MIAKVGFGGGCHWCTEAVFEHLIGVVKVQQGWIKSQTPFDTFSEAVIVEYDPSVISLEVLIQIHLHTHSSTSDHAMREKYRSAVYFFNPSDEVFLIKTLLKEEKENSHKYITKILPFEEFKSNTKQFLHYYKNSPEAPFCTTYITPKLSKLMHEFGKHVKGNFDNSKGEMD